MSDSNAEKILVIGPSWVGDMVMAQSLFIVLKQQFENCQITVMAPDWTRPIVDRMPQVANSIASEFSHGELALLKRRKLGQSLNKEGFTTAIVLPNSFKSALLPYFANIPKRVGWKGEWRVPLLTDCRTLDKEQHPLMVQRFAALGAEPSDDTPEPAPKPKLEIDNDERQRSVEKFKLNTAKKIIAICPGAEFGEAKQWPSGHFADMSNQLLEQGYQVWLFGSANDKKIATEIASKISLNHDSQFKNLAGDTNLSEAIDLLSFASACVSNDSGLMHIAAALGVPISAIYGSTSPKFTPPLADKVKLLMTEIECRPCFQRQCPLGHLRCLTDISPSQVAESVGSLL